MGITVKGDLHIQNYVESGASQTVNNYYNNRKIASVPTDDELRDALLVVMPLIKNSRQWFPVMKVLMHPLNVIQEGDFPAAESKIRSLVDKLPYEINCEDLTRMYRDGFVEHWELWTDASAPVHGSTFDQYKNIAERFTNEFK